MPATAVSHPPQRRFRINRKIGTAAGFLTLGILLYAVVGAVWGLLRPAYEGTVESGGVIAFAPAADIEFTSFITFAVITGVLGVICGLVSFVRAPEMRGALTLCWIGVVALIGAVAFFTVGELAASLTQRVAHTELEAGQDVAIVPPLAPGIAFVAAPLMAMMTYWFSMFLDPTPYGAADRPD
ncbi:hypothetical protein C3B44_03885 [Corynebacterium yudongzhengii]|uniref:DUF2567 domain-containing protein n=1 Tax=Corynebacterium yudongzhengii TaxID=2080740 RepID=A0A2U1T6H4_9CORY|nr:hypothetical protein [Corynebacterium yudongzhengii]AWB81607.1 hypothetical protein C3B44_03885 [Corynebacterium yudongzhengii]PWC01592.1 hypothetical protein DF222_06545 [Corynebacterium yudongzhengii]